MVWVRFVLKVVMELRLHILMLRNVVVYSAISGFRDVVYVLRVSFFLISTVNALGDHSPSHVIVRELALEDWSRG